MSTTILLTKEIEYPYRLKFGDGSFRVLVGASSASAATTKTKKSERKANKARIAALLSEIKDEKKEYQYRNYFYYSDLIDIFPILRGDVTQLIKFLDDTKATSANAMDYTFVVSNSTGKYCFAALANLAGVVNNINRPYLLLPFPQCEKAFLASATRWFPNKRTMRAARILHPTSVSKQFAKCVTRYENFTPKQKERKTPTLIKICSSVVARELLRDSNRKEILENFRGIESILNSIGKAILKMHVHQAYEVVNKIEQEFGSKFIQEMIPLQKLIKLRQDHDLILRAYDDVKFLPRGEKALSSLMISAFDNLDTFKYLPFEGEETCLPMYFPEYAASRPAGKPSIVSEEQFKKNLAAFTSNQLKFVDMSNMLIIGGAVAACASPVPDEFVGKEEAYFCEVYPGSDIDMCFINEENEDTAVKEFYQALVRSHPDVPITIISNTESVTFARHYPFRPIQIMGNFPSIYKTLMDIDIDCTAMGYDGTNLWVLPRARDALNRKANLVDEDLHGTRGCPHYEKRLLKYVKRGFSIIDIGLNFDELPQSVLTEPDKNLENWNFAYQGRQSGCGYEPGFGRKLLVRCAKWPWVMEAVLNRKTTPSVPFGPEWDSKKVEEFLKGLKDYDYYAHFDEFDGYTHYYTPPRIVDSIGELGLQFDDSTSFLTPYWAADCDPSVLPEEEDD